MSDGRKVTEVCFFISRHTLQLHPHSAHVGLRAETCAMEKPTPTDSENTTHFKDETYTYTKTHIRGWFQKRLKKKSDTPKSAKPTPLA